MPYSSYLAIQISKHITGLEEYTPPSTFEVGLHTADPGSSGLNNEVTGGGYSRQPVTFALDLTGFNCTNENVIEFSNMPSTTVTHITIWDSGTGMLLFHQALSGPNSKSLDPGDTLRIPEDTIVLRGESA